MQLVAHGAQNIYLTGNPSITFFKMVYKRHTNFSMESVEQTCTGSLNFGQTIKFDLARKGDLITKMWLQILLPPPTSVITATDSNYKRWVNNIGHALIEEASISIGGEVIDRQYSEWLDIWNELTDINKRDWTLIGKSENKEYTDQDQNIRYYVPLNFWFCRNYGLALPLIALQYHEVSVRIKIRDLKGLINTNGSNVSVSGSLKELSLYTDYILLDTSERKRFAQISHQYLIEQVQYLGLQSLKDGVNTIDLNFNHPVKEIVWVCRDKNRGSIDDTPLINTFRSDVNGNDWFNYSSTTLNTDLNLGTYDYFNTAEITLNGNIRFKERDALYFRQVQPHQHHTNIPNKNVYVYSFALNPERLQPSGTCNYSQINTSNLQLKGAKECDILVFATNYNILRIMNGLGGLAYSN